MACPLDTKVPLVPLWAAMLATQPILLVVLWVLFGQNPVQFPGGLLSNPILTVFALLALVQLGVALNIHRFLVRPAERSATDPDTHSPEATQRRVQTAYIIRLALLEAVGLFGMVAGVLSENIGPALPFLVVGGLAIFVSYPSTRMLRILSN